jgi:hypothetical protein
MTQKTEQFILTAAEALDNPEFLNANLASAGQKLPEFYENTRFIIVVTTANQ